jgi:hypothetical protein
MEINNKNIIYTFVPPKDGWKYNNSFYKIDLESLCLSALVIKKKFKFQQIKLYTTDEFCEFFNDTDLFDILIDIHKVSDDIKKVDTNKFHANTLYKLFVPSLEEGPFIHVDHDLFINDVEIFDRIKTDVFFSFHETPVEDGKTHFFYGFYLEALNKVREVVSEEVSINSSKDIAYNCSIFGCDDNSLKKSFTDTKEFFIRNFDKLIDINKIDCFLEQYLQINYLKNNRISTFDDIITKNGEILNIDIWGKVNNKKLNTLKKVFLEQPIIHVSGDRYSTYYRRLIPDLLKVYDKKIYNKILKNYKSNIL